ncbi:hypothetical protein D3C75_1145450 [compost metagenome]
MNPRYGTPSSTLVICVFLELTVRCSSSCNILVAVSLYLPASLLDFANTNISSAYLTIRIPLSIIFLSNLSKYMFISNADITPPCGLPMGVSINAPSSNTPASRKLLIIFSTFPSLILSFTPLIISS